MTIHLLTYMYVTNVYVSSVSLKIYSIVQYDGFTNYLTGCVWEEEMETH